MTDCTCPSCPHSPSVCWTKRCACCPVGAHATMRAFTRPEAPRPSASWEARANRQRKLLEEENNWTPTETDDVDERGQ